MADPVWKDDIQKYFNDNDIMHMAARGAMLDSYMWVSMNYPKIIGRIKDKSMPPGGWPQEKIDRFELWARNGWPKG